MAHKPQKMNQKDENIVYGYCKRMMKLFLSKHQILPRTIMYICLLNYVSLERFDYEECAESIEIIHGNIASWISNQPATVYGTFNIINKFNSCFSWTFKLLSCSNSSLAKYHQYPHQVGIGIHDASPKILKEVWWNTEKNNNSNLYVITTTGTAISVSYGIKSRSSYIRDNYFHDSFNYDDEIKMELNTKKDTLIFYKNDEEITYFRNVKLENEDKPYHMFISAQDLAVTIKLMDFKIIKLKN